MCRNTKITSYRRWWVISGIWLQVPFPVLIFLHLGIGDGFDFQHDLRLRQLEGSDPSWIHGATHLADLVAPALERQNPPRDEGADYIVG